MGFLVRNIAEAVDPPRFDRKEMLVLNPVGVAQLLQAAQGTELTAIVAVAIGTGLRRGELLALRWSDVNLDARRLTVHRSLETVKGLTRTKPPKTVRSARTIALPLFVTDILRAQRQQQEAQGRDLGLKADEDGWIFTRADGSSWEPGAFSLAFARFVKRAKLPRVRFHDLRHSFGTLALASGVDLQTVSRALGHESTAITSRTYLHAIEALQEDAAARIDALLGNAVTSALAKPVGSVALRQAQGDTVRQAQRDNPGESVPRPYHVAPLPIKKERQMKLFLVAPTGIEPANRGPGRSRRIPESLFLHGFSHSPVPVSPFEARRVLRNRSEPTPTGQIVRGKYQEGRQFRPIIILEARFSVAHRSLSIMCVLEISGIRNLTAKWNVLQIHHPTPLHRGLTP